MDPAKFVRRVLSGHQVFLKSGDLDTTVSKWELARSSLSPEEKGFTRTFLFEASRNLVIFRKKFTIF